MNKTKKILFSQGFVTILLVWGLCSPGITVSAQTARWNPRTTDWNQNRDPVIGDWGFDRPGYPKGLYFHGITVKVGEPILNPVIYDNDVYDDVFDDEWAYAMASLGEMNLAGLIVTPVLTDFWGFSRPDWKKTALESRQNAERSGIRMDKTLQLPSARKRIEKNLCAIKE